MKTEKTVKIYRNDKKKPTDPDYKGTIKTETGEIVLNVIFWENTLKNGEKYFKGYASEPKEKQA